MASGTRIRALDWHRALAVVVMIQTHTTVFLSADAASVPWKRAIVDRVDGMVAPSFIFAAGFALAMVMARAAQKPGGKKERALKSLSRIAEVYAVAMFFHMSKFAPYKHPWKFLLVDILSAIAYSLLILWAVMNLLGNRPRTVSAVMGSAAALVFFASPWTETLGAPAAHLLNTSTGSPFPLVPWAGWCFLGASLGALMSLPEIGLKRVVAGLSVLAIAGWAVHRSGPICDSVYSSSAGVLLDHADRMMWIAVVALALIGVEQFGMKKGWAMQNPLTKLLDFFGTNSLSAYFFHIILIYFSLGPLSLRGLHRNLSWTTYWFATLGVIVGTGVLCWLWGFADDRLPWRKKPAAAPAKA